MPNLQRWRRGLVLFVDDRRHYAREQLERFGEVPGTFDGACNGAFNAAFDGAFHGAFDGTIR